jgi:hypothetical protein
LDYQDSVTVGSNCYKRRSGSLAGIYSAGGERSRHPVEENMLLHVLIAGMRLEEIQEHIKILGSDG